MIKTLLLTKDRKIIKRHWEKVLGDDHPFISGQKVGSNEALIPKTRVGDAGTLPCKWFCKCRHLEPVLHHHNQMATISTLITPITPLPQ